MSRLQQKERLTSGLKGLGGQAGESGKKLGRTAQASTARATAVLSGTTAKAREKAAEVAPQISARAGELKNRAADVTGKVGQSVPAPVRTGATQAVTAVRTAMLVGRYRTAVMAGAGAALVWMVVRRKRG
ncbi:hypothetical protein [Streptomyces fragilis]|uniref:DUF3618 domain-containing protein n=1 Tax=Streptomyces fragilis TaxID=67301 RepID=A0ABV2YGQ4_9ACTN|nr:hypothetical protein [Streptomyces fragilis]